MPEDAQAVPSAAPSAPHDEREAEVARLERLLAERADALLGSRAELARVQGLLRDAVSRFESLVISSDAGPMAELARQRDLAVERALEAEAARAEVTLKLDELLGHLAAVGEAESAIPGESLATTCARLSGTVRGLLSLRAELEEARDALAARVMLLEHDLEDERDRTRARTRELAEARELVELEQVRAHGLLGELEGSVRAVEADALRGECQGLRARLGESERALGWSVEAGRSRIVELEQALAREIKNAAQAGEQARQATAQSLALREELARTASKAHELQSQLERGGASSSELEARLGRAEARMLDLQAELARTGARHAELERAYEQAKAQAAALQARLDLALEAKADTARTLEEAREAARAGEALRVRAEGSQRVMLEIRELVAGLAAGVERVLNDPGALTAVEGEDPSAPTEPGTPTYVQAIEGLEEQLTLRDQRIMELSGQLARDRGRLSALHGALLELRAGLAGGDPLADRIDPMIALFGQTGSWRP